MVHSKWEFYSLPTYSNVYTDSEENLEYLNWFHGRKNKYNEFYLGEIFILKKKKKKSFKLLNMRHWSRIRSLDFGKNTLTLTTLQASHPHPDWNPDNTHYILLSPEYICVQVYLITLWKKQDRFPLTGSQSGLSSSLWKCQCIVRPITRLLKGGEAWKKGCNWRRPWTHSQAL